jgi:hypothetical protein
MPEGQQTIDAEQEIVKVERCDAFLANADLVAAVDAVIAEKKVAEQIIEPSLVVLGKEV